MPTTRKARATRSLVNPSFIGGGFVRYCLAQGWLVLTGKGKTAHYQVTPQGRAALRFFGIET
jgi:hypothetical protein